MNFDYYLERQELLTQLIMLDTIESTFDNVKQYLQRCNPNNTELRLIIKELIESELVKQELRNNGVDVK